MSIGYTTTRGGVPLIDMPYINEADCLPSCKLKVSAVSFEQVGHTQVLSTPYNNSTQTNSLPGIHWQGSMSFARHDWCDEAERELKAWQAKLRGSAGRFRVWDITSGGCCNALGQSFDVSADSVSAEHVGSDLVPSDDLVPADDLVPSLGSFPQWDFTLSLAFDGESQGLNVTADTIEGTTLPVNSINLGASIVNSNPWPVGSGFNPFYESAYTQALANLSQQMGGLDPANLGNKLITKGSYIQVEDMYLMVVEDFKQGDTEITFEPPLAHPVSAGTKIEFKRPSMVARLVDDNQVGWSASGGKKKTAFSQLNFVQDIY